MVFTIAALLFFKDIDVWRGALEDYLTTARGTLWALPVVVAFYVIGGFVLFPVSVLNLACPIVFGIPGIFYSIVGSLANVAVFFGVGRLIRKKYRRRLLSYPKIKKVDDMLKSAGVSGTIGVRIIPVPPYTVVNLAAGLTGIPFYIFALGSFLVLIPGSVARGVFGASLGKILTDPEPENYVYLDLGLALWAGFIAATHAAVKKFQPAAA